MGGRDKKSKKRSATRSIKPLSHFVFFVDRSLGRKAVAKALRGADAAVEIHDDHLPSDATDEKWLTYVGERNWVALTQDARIRYRENELQALVRANVRAFVLTAKNLRGEENAAIVVQALPAMVRFLSKHDAPFVARIARNGKIDLLYKVRAKKSSGVPK